jgi:hypothetical protein
MRSKDMMVRSEFLTGGAGGIGVGDRIGCGAGFVSI